jgi:hypothetical protein
VTGLRQFAGFDGRITKLLDVNIHSSSFRPRANDDTASISRD